MWVPPKDHKIVRPKKYKPSFDTDISKTIAQEVKRLKDDSTKKRKTVVSLKNLKIKGP